MTEQNNNHITNNQNKGEEIDLIALFKQLFDNRKKIFKAAGIGIIISLIIGFSLPREYRVEVLLSPESGTNATGSIASLASMFGVSGMSGVNEDALNVTLFPEIIKTTPFLLEMFETPVRTSDDETMTLYEYLDVQSKPWWSVLFPRTIIDNISSLFKEDEMNEDETIDSFKLTKEQSKRIKMLQETISAEIDKKTNITKISVTLQDPLAAALVADSAVVKLQRYITDYRTRKAQEDYDYLTNMTKETEQDYINAQQKYSQFMDANRNVNLQSMKMEAERLQKAASTAYQIYSQMETQRQLARAKVQEAKPIFAVVEPATVPLIPSSPRKMIILIVFVFLAVAIESGWILFGKELWKDFKTEMKKTQR